jgi:hypothetical protein
MSLMRLSFIHLVEWFTWPTSSFLRGIRSWVSPQIQTKTLRKRAIKRKASPLNRVASIHVCILIIFNSFSSIEACSGHLVNPAINSCESCLFPMNVHLLSQAPEIKEGENS